MSFNKVVGGKIPDVKESVSKCENLITQAISNSRSANLRNTIKECMYLLQYGSIEALDDFINRLEAADTFDHRPADTRLAEAEALAAKRAETIYYLESANANSELKLINKPGVSTVKIDNIKDHKENLRLQELVVVLEAKVTALEERNAALASSNRRYFFENIKLKKQQPETEGDGVSQYVANLERAIRDAYNEIKNL